MVHGPRNSDKCGVRISMEKKKFEFKGIHAGAEKVTGLLGKTKEKVVNAMDQNDDGELNVRDVSVVADAIGNAAKKTASSLKDNLEERNREVERKRLQPIFAEDLDSADFFMSKLIRITDIDKKRAESEVCQESIGYVFPQKELRVINLFSDKIDAFGLSFYPDKNSEIYYVDPSDRDKYIALDDYFSFLKVARVSELQKIAQDLGAKHFKVTYKESKTSFSKKHVKAKTNVKGLKDGVNTDTEYDLAANDVSTVEIAAEATFPGHEPVEPTLRYFQRDPSIQALVAMRMDEKAPISHQKYILNLSNSSGIKEKDAIKIDAALKAMKISGDATVTSEAKNEARRFFEYEIDF